MAAAQMRTKATKGGSGGSKVLSFFTKSTSFAVPRAASPPHHHYTTFSGPILIPAEARRRDRPQSSTASGFRTPEVTSPTVSCMGQIKIKQKKKKKNTKPPPAPEKKKKPVPEQSSESSVMQRVFGRRSRPEERDKEKKKEKETAPSPAPAAPLRRFTSGRHDNLLRDFDWRKVGADGDEEEEKARVMSYSMPLVLGGGVVAPEPRKEVNLWKRRPMEALPPLRVQ